MLVNSIDISTSNECKKLIKSYIYGVSNLIWHRGDNEIYFGEIPINPVKVSSLLLSRRGAESCVLLKYTIKTGMRVAMPGKLFQCQPLQVIASCCLNVSHLRKMISSVSDQAQREPCSFHNHCLDTASLLLLCKLQWTNAGVSSDSTYS